MKNINNINNIKKISIKITLIFFCSNYLSINAQQMPMIANAHSENRIEKNINTLMYALKQKQEEEKKQVQRMLMLAFMADQDGKPAIVNYFLLQAEQSYKKIGDLNNLKEIDRIIRMNAPYLSIHLPSAAPQIANELASMIGKEFVKFEKGAIRIKKYFMPVSEGTVFSPDYYNLILLKYQQQQVAYMGMQSAFALIYKREINYKDFASEFLKIAEQSYKAMGDSNSEKEVRNILKLNEKNSDATLTAIGLHLASIDGYEAFLQNLTILKAKAKEEKPIF